MNNAFSLSFINAQKSQAVKELRECNVITEKYALSLTDEQINSLVERRFAALNDTGRIEFGEGIVKKLISEFCDSPYIFQENYEDTVTELQDSFYYFKNESMDLFSDDEIISYMRKCFDGVCHGSIEYMSDITLEELCRSARNGYNAYGVTEKNDLRGER